VRVAVFAILAAMLCACGVLVPREATRSDLLNFKAVEKRVSDGTIILVTGIAGSAGEIDHVDIRRNNDVVDVHIFVELTRNSTPIGPDHRTGVLKESIYVPDSANVVLLAGDGSVIWRRPVKAKRYEG
jgi:hypothetical protein